MQKNDIVMMLELERLMWNRDLLELENLSIIRHNISAPAVRWFDGKGGYSFAHKRSGGTRLFLFLWASMIGIVLVFGLMAGAAVYWFG